MSCREKVCGKESERDREKESGRERVAKIDREKESGRERVAKIDREW